MPTPLIINIHERFTRLVVVSFYGANKQGKRTYLCICDCGNTTLATASHLRRGERRSCGCLKRESPQHFKTVHGMCGTPEHEAWCRMKTRCYDSKHPRHADWGGRGIKVCLGFMDFEAFYRIVGPRPSPELSNDRINNDGNYSCGECSECVERGWKLNIRWATPEEQGRNKRNNRMLTYDGKTMCAAEWGELLDISPATIRDRLNGGWSDERALTTPVEARKPRKVKA